MISKQYLQYLDELSTYQLTDYTTHEELLARLKDEWGFLQYLYTDTYFDKDRLQDTLFNLARRGYELCSLLTKDDVLYYLHLAKELHEKKNAGYSGDNEDSWINFRQCEKFGISAKDGVITRLSDKYVRFWNVSLHYQNERVGETLIDTLMDMSAYCLILMCLLDETQSIYCHCSNCRSRHESAS